MRLALVLIPVVGTADAALGGTAEFNGDANCDLQIDSLDAALVLQYDAGLVGQLPFLPAADPSKDGIVNSKDAALILQFHAGLISDRQANYCILS
jgi:hypothetical protein